MSYYFLTQLLDKMKGVDIGVEEKKSLVITLGMHMEAIKCLLRKLLGCCQGFSSLWEWPGEK